MAYEIPNFFVGVLPADIDMSANAATTSQDPVFQYTGVCVYTAISTVGTGVGGAALIPPASTSSPIIGVLQNNPRQGEAGTVMCQGVTKCLAGGSFNVGNVLMMNSSGAAVLWTTGSGYSIGIALETGVAGQIGAVLLQRNGKT